eukprot:scaffold681277_cov97-Prasinocladus_malaysianus.AAC.1
MNLSCSLFELDVYGTLQLHHSMKQKRLSLTCCRCLGEGRLWELRHVQCRRVRDPPGTRRGQRVQPAEGAGA